MLIQYLDEHPDAQWRHSGRRRGRVRRVDGVGARRAVPGRPRPVRRRRGVRRPVAARVVALQAGDEATVQRWREIVDESELAFREIYGRLGVLLEPGDSAGESFYNQWLAEVVDELLAAGVAVAQRRRGRRRVGGRQGPDGQPVPLIVQKRDGGYGYDTTDLATMRYRVRDLKADRILYVVDARQALHFRLIFEAARRMGWLAEHEGVEAVHVAFGTVLGPDGRPFKTRAGGTVRLMHLIDEAVDSGAPHRRRARARPARGRAGPHRRAGRRRRGQVRRPVDLPRQGLHVRHRADGVADRQHQRLPAVRARPDPVDPAQGRLRGRRDRPGPDRSGTAAAPGRAGAGAGARRVRRRAARRRRDERATPASATTCSTRRRRSPTSTRTARCSRHPTTCGSTGWRCAGSRRRPCTTGSACWGSLRRSG